ncbi:hypothetical protein FBU59_006324, partial [Linderina macrospora]
WSPGDAGDDRCSEPGVVRELPPRRRCSRSPPVPVIGPCLIDVLARAGSFADRSCLIMRPLRMSRPAPPSEPPSESLPISELPESESYGDRRWLVWFESRGKPLRAFVARAGIVLRETAVVLLLYSVRNPGVGFGIF